MKTTFRQALARPWIPPEYGNLQYVWLLSLGYLFWKFAYVTPGALELALLALTLAVFIPLYCASFWAPRRSSSSPAPCAPGSRALAARSAPCWA